jgi:hypothetical protein
MPCEGGEVVAGVDLDDPQREVVDGAERCGRGDQAVGRDNLRDDPVIHGNPLLRADP